MSKEKQILLVGCGKMGGALLRQWVEVKELNFTVVEPTHTNVPAEVNHCDSPSQLGDKRFDVIIIAIKPQMIDEVMPSYRSFLLDDGCVISIAAGCAMSSLKAIWDGHAILRMMPNMPAFIGKGISGLVADDLATAAQRDLLEQLANQVGQSVWVESEDMLDRLTAVSGSGPGYVFEIARVYVEAAKSLGFSNSEARKLALSTIAGTAQMATASDASLTDLRNSVTSKKGTTEAGLNALNGGGEISERLQHALQAAYDRAVELR